jgi:hypothetical protein
MNAPKPFVIPAVPNWQDVTNALEVPSGRITAVEELAHPFSRFTMASFGHQDGRHIGGVPGRIGGCDARRRWAVRGLVSGQLLSWRGLIIVHDNSAELRFLIAGEVAIKEIPPTIEAEHTIWIKDHPDFQSVEWPLNRADFKESRD